MNIAVIYGGKSNEREVSLKTGSGVVKALGELGHSVIAIEFKEHQDLIEKLTEISVDLVYIGLHGKYGEDGRVQSLLELLDLPYIGSGVMASALAMNKSLSKKIFESVGIATAREILLSKKEIQDDNSTLIEKILAKISLPLVIKPNQEGSTIGLSIANDKSEIEKGLLLAQNFDADIMIEEYIEGTEITVAVLGRDNDIQALPVIEIIPKNKHYDYESKYMPGGSEHIIPARINKESYKLAQKWAVEAHKSLTCETYSRVDFIVNKDNKPIILEINTLPGMTETSLFPDAASSIGLDYKDMLQKIIDYALAKYK